jgi:hypothetical protein
MARSTFTGPILSGDSRFGLIRDVGYTELVQNVQLNFANTGGNGTAGYPGASGSFVNGNQIPNIASPVYTQSATAYPPTTATITADAATTVYRGAVAYLPVGSTITDLLIEVGTGVGTSGSTLTAATVNVGNQFNGTQYGSSTLTVSTNAITAGTYTVTTTADNLWATTADFTNPTGLVEPAVFSQVVFTLVLTGTGTPAPNAGTIYFTVRYKQLDGNIGTTTAYPYGNFD